MLNETQYGLIDGKKKKTGTFKFIQNLLVLDEEEADH